MGVSLWSAVLLRPAFPAKASPAAGRVRVSGTGFNREGARSHKPRSPASRLSSNIAKPQIHRPMNNCGSELAREAFIPAPEDSANVPASSRASSLPQGPCLQRDSAASGRRGISYRGMRLVSCNGDAPGLGSVATDPFPAKASPTRSTPARVGPASAGKGPAGQPSTLRCGYDAFG
jgi:hypothetical protein